MNTKQKTIAIIVLIMSLLVSSCGQGKLGSSDMATPKPTSKPFTSSVVIGAWVGEISIPLDSDESESANIRLLIKNEKTIGYYLRPTTTIFAYF